jgi:hypothetical protein
MKQDRKPSGLYEVAAQVEYTPVAALRKVTN